MPRLSTRQKVIIAQILNRIIRLGRSIARKPMQGEFMRNGLRWHLDLNEGIDLAIYLLGAFERDLVRCYERLIKPGDIVLDIGANIGAHTLPLARAVGATGKVVAIEATAYGVQKLQKNLALNRDLEGRVAIAHSLLVSEGNTAKETHIYSRWPLAKAEASHPVLAGSLEPIGNARICTLDQIVSELGLQHVNLMKLDVDGHELSVLHGAQQLLEQHRPDILMELAPYCYSEQPGGFDSLVELLSKASYSFYLLDTTTRLPNTPEELAKNYIPKNGSINILARRT